MSDLLYDIFWNMGYPALWTSSKPTILHRERLSRAGGFIVASTHLSPYDVPLLMYANNRRRLDFVSIVELFRKPFVAALFNALNAVPLDRSRPDITTVRTLIRRLQRGRVVSIFPEGALQTEQTSALNGGPIKAGFAQIARLARVPVAPVVVLNGSAFQRFSAHLPLRRTRWGVGIGELIEPNPSIGEDQDARRMTDALRQSWYTLRDELLDAMNLKDPDRKPA